MNNLSKNVVVGMSGGVDSSVSALLLKQQGYQVEGIFMQNWDADDKDPFCSAQQDLTDARAVCDRIGISLRTVNFSQDYWDKVFQHFLDEYAAGRTPNPDIICNKEIKFKAFLNHIQQLGAHYLATGHYVRCEQRHGEYILLKGLDNNKDQSYFLYTLNQEQLPYCLFPVGELEKSSVREVAEKNGFINHAKKDSTGICFIGERKFKNFLQEYLLTKPGNIVSIHGKYLGQHDGLMFHTIGQRKGLKIGGCRGASESPWYVVAKELERNQLIVAQGQNHPHLYANGLFCRQLHWVSNIAPNQPFQCKAKIRYRQQEQFCNVTQIEDDCFQVIFDAPQRAITPGQSVVFYQQDRCLGGGVIEKVLDC